MVWNFELLSRQPGHILDRSSSHQGLQRLIRSRTGFGTVCPNVHTLGNFRRAGGLDGEFVTRHDPNIEECTLESPQRKLYTFLKIRGYRHQIPRGFRRGWWQTNGMLIPCDWQASRTVMPSGTL